MTNYTFSPSPSHPVTPTVADAVQGDEWNSHQEFAPVSDFDRQIFGEDVMRIEVDGIIDSYAAQVKVTGRKVHVVDTAGHRRIRVQITPWVDDDTMGESFTAWMWIRNYQARGIV